MKPKDRTDNQHDLFRSRLDQQIDLNHPLVRLIEAAVGAKLIERRDLKSVVVDTTVQEKAVKHPVDSWLLDRARRHVVAAADKAGIVLRQGYPRVGRRLLHQAQRYGHAGQYKRMGKVVKQLRNLLGRVIRDVARKLDKPQEQYPALSPTLDKARRLFFQRRDDLEADVYEAAIKDSLDFQVYEAILTWWTRKVCGTSTGQRIDS